MINVENKILITSAKDKNLIGDFDQSSYWRKPFFTKGYDVDLYDFNESIPADIESYNKIVKKIVGSNALNFFYKKAEDRFIAELNKTKYDMFLNFNNKNIRKELLMSMKEKFPEMKLVDVFYDNPFFYNNVMNSIDLYDTFYVKDEYFERELRKMGYKNVKYMLHAYSSDYTEIVDKSALNFKDVNHYSADVSFIGSLYPQRTKILEQIKIRNIKLWGKSVWNSVDKNSWLMAHRMKEIVINKQMSKVIGLTKVNMNTHNYQNDIESTNNRTFDTLGSGGFLLTDYKPTIDKYFVIGKELMTFTHPEEMNEMIKYYIDSDEDRKEIALRGYNRVNNQHTFYNRTQQILGDNK